MVDLRQTPASAQPDPSGGQPLDQLVGDDAVVDDPGLGHLEAGDPGSRRLDLGDLLSRQSPQAGQAVGVTTPFQFRQGRQLLLACCNDELAATLVGDLVALAEPVELLAAGGTGRRLGGAWAVVEAGMDNAAVVAGLVACRAGFGLEHGQPLAECRCQRAGGGQTDDPATDDHHLDAVSCHRIAA